VAGAPSPCTVRDALAAFRVAEACELSRSKGQLVDLAEIGGDDTTPRNRSLRSRFREDPA
jgi:hypothetical protein